MSSTRKAKDESVYHQGRYASAPEFERGLVASLVARRCSVLEAPADRELIWYIHHASHQPGGLKALAKSLVDLAGDKIGTAAMCRIGQVPGNFYNAEQVALIRRDFPSSLKGKFPLYGEISPREQGALYNIKLLRLRHEAGQIISGSLDEVEKEETALRELAEIASLNHPQGYAVELFANLCQTAALEVSGTDPAGLLHLEQFLMDLCLDPGQPLKARMPWYFANLEPVLRLHLDAAKARAAAGVVVTALGREVYSMMDRTLEGGSIALMAGNARTGKSFSARAWCEQHPGQARFIEIPVGNDDSSFYRALARGLGLGNFTQAKAMELRERVESVLLTRDLLVILDEAHRLWPQRNLRYGFPSRVNWVMSMANQGVAFCLISTPQFLQQQKQMEQAGWNSAQFVGRVRRYKTLPAGLSDEDLQAVAQAVLPEADARTLKAIAIYSRTSTRYLAAIESIAEEARFLAGRHGRSKATAADVAAAMQCVIPSDTGLVDALKAADRPGRGRGQRPVDPVDEVAPDCVAMQRATRPAVPALDTDFPRREVSPAVQPLEVAA